MTTIILNTRPEHQSIKLTAELKKIGCEVIALPLMTIEPISLASKNIDVDIAVFLSANAVEHFFNQTELNAETVVAIGPATANALEKKGIKKVQLPDEFCSDGLLAMPLLQQVEHKKIAIISGENSKKLLPIALEKRQATIFAIECYRRKKIAYDVAALFPAMNTVTDILVTSSENLEALLDLFKKKSDWLINKNICVINSDMKKIANAFGFQRVLQADNATDEAIVTVYNKGNIMTTESPVIKNNMWRYITLSCSVAALAISVFTYVNTHNGSVDAQLQAVQTNVAGLSQNLSGTTLAMQRQLLEIKNNTSLSSQKILAEVSFLATVAQTQLTADYNVDAALQTLANAQALLASANDVGFMPVAAAIQSDREMLSKNIMVNQGVLFFQLSSLIQKVESLTTLPQAPTASLNATILQNTQKTWHAKWDDLLSQLKKLIVIRHVNDTTPPLVAPNMEMYLKQNIVTQLTIAQWALLHHNKIVYQTALESAKTWIVEYFALTPQKDDVTAALTQLMSIDIAPAMPTLSNTFNAIAATRIQPVAAVPPAVNNTAPVAATAAPPVAPANPQTQPQPDQTQTKPPVIHSSSVEA